MLKIYFDIKQNDDLLNSESKTVLTEIKLLQNRIQLRFKSIKRKTLAVTSRSNMTSNSSETFSDLI